MIGEGREVPGAELSAIWGQYNDSMHLPEKTNISFVNLSRNQGGSLESHAHNTHRIELLTTSSTCITKRKALTIVSAAIAILRTEQITLISERSLRLVSSRGRGVSIASYFIRCG